jgi:acetylornithine/succinyldiaminopimelate/putrescine aminotransferase
MMPGFKYVPFDDLEAVKNVINDETCAILVEPIQSEGGVNVPSPGYLQGLRDICDANNLLLIFDEVQTAMGRLGKFFGYQSYGVEPDILTMAKSLGGGVPIGAMLTKQRIAESLGPGTHAATFGGNPLVSAAAIAAVTTVIEENLAENAAKIGEYFMGKLLDLKAKFPQVIEGVRGRGLIIGLVLAIDGKPVASKCIDNGLLTICTMDHVLRFLPPLIINEKHVDEAVEIVVKILSDA